MKLAEFRHLLGVLYCIMAAIPCSAAVEQTMEPPDLEGVWRVVKTRGQVGLCRTATATGTGRTEAGRVTTSQDRVRLESADDGSWSIWRLQPDGVPVGQVTKWTLEVRPDGSVVSSRQTQARCGARPPRDYKLELRGKLKEKKKRLRIELRGTDDVCPEMGCSFKVTHIFTQILVNE